MKIVAEKLYKTFNKVPVVDEVSFRVGAGEILGILGPNGAGKTTTLRMVLDIIKPDKGDILFDDQPIHWRIKDQIGYLPEERGIYQKYALIDVLVYFGRLKNLSQKKASVEAVRLLDRFGMIDLLESPVNHLSKGMQQKVQLMIALIHDPQVLIFDEPFFGLDPLNQEIIRNLLRQYRKEGKTIILSTHQMNEAENLCDEILLIDQGKAILYGSLKNIRERFQENLILVESEENLEVLKGIPGVSRMVIEKRIARLYVDKRVPHRQILNKVIEAIPVSRLEINRPSLNDIFLEVVKNGRRERT